MDTLNSKQCRTCQEWLPYTAFYKGKQGYNPSCKPCYIEYQTTYRQKRASSGRPIQRPLFIINRERLSLGGLYRCRYTHTHRPCTLSMLPYGYILDGVLVYGTYDIEDILLYLHDKKAKVIEKEAVDASDAFRSVRNSCGVPIEAEVLIGLVSLDQYYLWMDNPRPLTLDEVSHIVHLAVPTINFVLHAKKPMVPIRPHSPGEQISGPIIPQVPNITPVIKEDLDDIVFVEE